MLDSHTITVFGGMFALMTHGPPNKRFSIKLFYG